jgi:hypothetical protein
VRAWRLSIGVFPSISKSVPLLFVPNGESRLGSGTREVNATPVDESEVGKVEKIPLVAVEWRFNIRRDIMVTLKLWAVKLGDTLGRG